MQRVLLFSPRIIFFHPLYTNTCRKYFWLTNVCLKLSSWTIYNQLTTALVVKFPNQRVLGRISDGKDLFQVIKLPNHFSSYEEKDISQDSARPAEGA